MMIPSPSYARTLSLDSLARLTIALCIGSLGAGAAPALFALQSSTPTDVPRPGPDILYAAPVAAPQFQNAGIWAAPPIRISGASAYRNGEFLYQDFIYDDQGANGGYTYPTDPVYARNAADFVEIRLKLQTAATAFRITYNSMLDPERVATTIALGSSITPRQMPHGANTQSVGQVFVTVHGGTGAMIDGSTGLLLGALAASVSLERRQVEFSVPYAVFDPRGQSAIRIAAATGLWDTVNGQYSIPQSSATATNPGGAGSREKPSAFFNVAFRYTESGPWNNSQQNTVLNPSNPDISAFFATVDFTKLAAGVNDDMAGQIGGVPQTGYIYRILASQFEPQQGRGPNTSSISGRPQPTGLAPDFAGRLQPYTLYVPNKPMPDRGYALTLRPHPCGGNYKSLVAGTTNPIGERGDGALVVFPLGRGNCLWYWSESGADVFEAWADVAAHYSLDPTNITISGFSMGGYASYKFIGQWPDLFTTGVPIAGCASAEAPWPGPPVPNASGPATVINLMLPSFRNVPLLSANGVYDPICTFTAQDTILHDLDQLGYRYEWRDYPADHSVVIDDQSVADYFGVKVVDRNPPHVTYVYNLKASETPFGLNADHAYWLSGLKLRDESGSAPAGKIDVRSHGFGIGDPTPQQTQPIATTGYAGFRKDWGPAPAEPVENRLDIVAQNISAVTIQPDRARVDCRATLNIQSDGPITVALAGCQMPTQDGNKTVGGGWLATGSNGKIDFNFKAEETTGGPKGDLQLRDDGANVKIHLTQVTSLGPVGPGCGSIPADAANALEFSGIGVFNDAGAQFRVCVRDNSVDQFYLECTSGCAYRSNTSADDFIDGGNIQVHRRGTADNTSGSGTPTTVTLDPLLNARVAGQPLTFTISVFDQQQKPLANASVTLSNVAASVTGRTNFLGIATIPIVILPGEYTATAGGVQSNALRVGP